MFNWRTLAVGLLALAIAATVAIPGAFADEKNLGKHSPDEIKNACNKAGGQLLGFSDLGSYGCEVADKGTMILCNKDQNCTGYTPARTHTDHNRILNSLKLKVKPTIKATPR